MELIDKSALVAEIERRIAAYQKNFDKANNTIARVSTDGRMESLKALLAFINTLETKYVDLEKDVDRILYENDWDYDEIDFYEFAKHFFELGLAQKDLTLSNYDKAMITTITNALNYLEELNDSKGHDNVPSQYQSEKDWLKSLKERMKGEKA